MNNDHVPSSIEVNGRVYHYDYDYDCYYRIPNTKPESNRERFLKVVAASLFLIAMVVFADFSHR